MERDFGKELDELKNEVKRLGELLDGKAAAGQAAGRRGKGRTYPADTEYAPRPEAFVADG